jgi:nicotinamidase-related amidase
MDGYDSATTGLIITDPYNEFISEGGRVWAMTKQVAEAVGMLDNMRQIASTARAAGIQVFYSQHRRWRPGEYEGWRQLTDGQARAAELRLFPADGWGGQWHPDFVPQPGDVLIHEHWAQSGFANTDLDMQLKQHNIQKIIIVGMIANTCIESTGRFGMELGYHVTLVRDATAANSMEAMHAALEINGPTFAHAITDTKSLVAAISS